MNNDELTPSEKKAMETLPRERMPRAALEEKVVKALRHRGTLRTRRQRFVEITASRAVAVLAASFALVIGGFALGQWVSSRQTAQIVSAVVEQNEMSAAASLQQAGTFYLMALERLASLPDTTRSEELRQGREVALSTLYTAADQVSKFVPRQYLASQLLQAIEAGEAERTTKTQPKAIWF